MREVRELWNTLYSPKFAVSLPLKFCFFTKFFSHAKSCAPCSKAKAACKPFDADRAQAKARAETIWRSQARKMKQQTDAEWKEQVLEKLGKVDKLVVYVTNFIRPYLHQLFIDSHCLNGYGKPLKRPFDRY